MVQFNKNIIQIGKDVEKCIDLMRSSIKQN